VHFYREIKNPKLESLVLYCCRISWSIEDKRGWSASASRVLLGCQMSKNLQDTSSINIFVTDAAKKYL